MRSRSLFAAAWVLGALLFVSTAPAQSAVLVVQFDAASPPTMYRSGDGAATGLYPAIVRTAFERMKHPASLRAVPFKRLIHDLEIAAAAAGGVVRNTPRDRFAVFSAPYYTEHIEVFSRDDGTPRFRRLADLDGQRVGVIRGWSYGDAIDAARNASRWRSAEVDSDRQNLEKLAAGRIDYALVNRLAARVLLSDPRFRDLRQGEAPIVNIDIHLALPRYRADPALLRAFDVEIERLRADHRLQALEDEAVRRAIENRPRPRPR